MALSKSWVLAGCNISISVEEMLHIKEIITAEKLKHALPWDEQHI